MAFGGLYIENSSLLKKLEECEDVTSLCFGYGNWHKFFDIDLDLSKLTKLRKLYICQLNLNSLSLPVNIENLVIRDCKSFPSLTGLTKLNYLFYAKGGSYDDYAISNYVDSLNSKTLNNEVEIGIYLSGLNELTNLNCLENKFNCNYLEIQNCNSLVSLSGINSMKNITEIKCVNNKSLVNITGMNELTNINKLTLSGCGIIDLSEIKELSNLEYVDLQNNPLAEKYGDVDNMSILASLREKNSSLKLYLSGCNNILDFSKLSAYGSWWHDSEKSGY